jgi:transcriptional regulator with XRE-family HTH domain
MDEMSTARLRDGALLSAAVRGVRRLRRMSTRETAAAMNVTLRTYQRFEAGEARLNLDHIHRFAEATESDPYAILMAIAVGSPSLAVHSADNKFGAILTIALGKLDEKLGEDLARLDTRTLVGVITEAFDHLAERAAQPDPGRAWLKDGEALLSTRRPRPGR